MKEEETDRVLSELFRQKLENADVMPSPGVKANLMRRMVRREFLHFNPARFNIWYACGIAVAGAALVFVLSSGSEKKRTESAPAATVNINKPATPEVLNQTSPDVNPGIRSERTAVASDKSEKDLKTATTGSVEKTGPASESLQNSRKSLQPDYVSSLPNDGLLRNNIKNRDELQKGAISGGKYIEASVTRGCMPLRVKFTNICAECDSSHWSFGDGGFSAGKNSEWLFDVPGEYIVTLTAFNKNSQAESTVTITVFPKPEARFEITPEPAVLPDNEITFHNYSTNALKYKWSFGDGSSSELFEPKYIYRKFGNYSVKLVAISEHGCYDSLTVFNAFSGSGYFINFPNAFIPNPYGPLSGFYSSKSDESAQIFHPVFSGVSEYQLRIYSRRGILVFESNDVNIGWDGYFKGQLSESGVYVWKVRGSFINGEPFTKMGDVTILKN